MFRESPRAPTRDGVLHAAGKIAALLPPTPLLPVEIAGVRVHAKADVLQPIGAFKIRGAWHRLTDLTPEERKAGVVAVSSGNHAQGVAWAARELGIAAAIVMPADAPRVKLEATRALGALSPAGTTPAAASAAEIDDTSDTLILDLGVRVPQNGTLLLSAARDA